MAWGHEIVDKDSGADGLGHEIENSSVDSLVPCLAPQIRVFAEDF